MFFRIWFLYLLKLVSIAWVMLFAAQIFRNWPWVEVVGDAALWVVGIMSVCGALLTVPLLIWPRRIRCPLCASIGEPVICGKFQPGVDCPHCGVVYAEHFLWSFQLCIDADEKPDDDAESGPPGN